MVTGIVGHRRQLLRVFCLKIINFFLLSFKKKCYNHLKIQILVNSYKRSVIRKLPSDTKYCIAINTKCNVRITNKIDVPNSVTYLSHCGHVYLSNMYFGAAPRTKTKTIKKKVFKRDETSCSYIITIIDFIVNMIWETYMTIQQAREYPL